MENYFPLIALGIVILCMVYTIYIKPTIVKENKLTQYQLNYIDSAVNKALAYAEILYKNDPTVNKEKVAIDYAFELVKEAGVIPDQYVNIIKVIIEDKILNK